MNDTNEDYKFILENENSKITLNKKGGIESFIVKEKNYKNIELIYSKKIQPLTIEPNIIYSKEPAKYEIDKYLTLTGKLGNDVDVETTYKYLDDRGLISINMNLTNKSDKAIKISNFKLGIGPGLATDEISKTNASIKNIMLAYYSDSKFYKKPKVGVYALNNSWCSVTNHYFISTLIDKNNFFQSLEVVDNLDANKLSSAFYTKDIVLNPNAKTNIELNTYFGIKNYNYLKSLNKGLEQNVSLGVFGFIGKWILFLLSFFYTFLGNYGWAIIVLTLILQIFLLPLNKKSYQAMHAMKKLQPKLENLKLKYKGDSQRLNTEMMLLYKQEKVNPFGGCLPLLLQIPIFWALFTALSSATELRHAPFMLWMTDLSKPDTVGHISGISINILPILMCVTMFISQKMNMGKGSSSGDDMQNKMMLFMPVMFLFMFWNFPSGLVLYWLVSNLCTIGLNSYLMLKNKN
jgi:YidC/Oxa1 family membrane protein insertase